MYAWSSYLGPNYRPGDETLPDYASASRRKDLSNLPPAYIACGNLDLFLNECRDYAQRLNDHGVDVEYEEITGGFHGMLSFGNDKYPVIELWKSFQSFGEKYLKPG
jgi:acetyl esterase/lipase